MNEKIEQVARALCRQYEIDDGFSPEQADRAASSDMHRNFIKAARAAIEAMREPTERMMVAAELAFPLLLTFADKEESGSYIAYRAMIDEALK